ncbi:MAG: L,D-transpeptidase [Candidatus Levybacteria bacterium]|nr:L,D-transpeptidase [Candidatus Levybacteria bacterium]
MRKKIIILVTLFIALAIFSFLTTLFVQKPVQSEIKEIAKHHWFLLHRKSNIEYLYYGTFGDANNSQLLKTFQVKVGQILSPTPLPQLLGRGYWLLIKKESSSENLDTAPYFLTLDVPSNGEWPYGPTPYLECNGQCDWQMPGYFGLHGINGNLDKLSSEDVGSLGCVRHKDEDITYLYNTLHPETEEIRYYIVDI